MTTAPSRCICFGLLTCLSIYIVTHLGLAYVHLVRNTALTGTMLPLPQQDVLGTLETGLLVWPTTEK